MKTSNAKMVNQMAKLFYYPDELPDTDELDLQIPHETMELTSLQGDYIRLFVNSLPNVPCPPYASWYLEGTLMGSSTLWISELFGKYGIAIKESELPDHISSELEFVSYLHLLQENGKDVEEDLCTMTKHLSEWFPLFLNVLEKEGKTGFYHTLATEVGTKLGIIGKHNQ